MSLPGKKLSNMGKKLPNTSKEQMAITSSSSKNEIAGSKQKRHSVVDASSGERKVCKEYCIRTWNVRFMNQGKLDMVKQEMARVNIDILGISELK